jgi:hypothetical protein
LRVEDERLVRVIHYCGWGIVIGAGLVIDGGRHVAFGASVQIEDANVGSRAARRHRGQRQSENERQSRVTPHFVLTFKSRSMHETD